MAKRLHEPHALEPLLALAGVRERLAAAREAADDALRNPVLRSDSGAIAAESSLRSAVASAALEGQRYVLEEVRSATATDPVLQGALRVSAALDALAARWTRSPRQVLARLHLLAARGCPGVDEASLGRPETSPVVAARLESLWELITSPAPQVPALLRAAVVHGELLALHPFPGPNAVVARAAARLTLIASGLDGRGLLAPEVGHLARQPEYVGAANAFATGTRDGLRSWLAHCAAAVEVAAAALCDQADSAASPRE